GAPVRFLERGDAWVHTFQVGEVSRWPPPGTAAGRDQVVRVEISRMQRGVPSVREMVAGSRAARVSSRAAARATRAMSPPPLRLPAAADLRARGVLRRRYGPRR